MAHSVVGTSAVSVAAHQTFGPRIQEIFASSVCDLRLTSETERELDLPRQRDLQNNARSYPQGRYHISQNKPDIDLDPSLWPAAASARCASPLRAQVFRRRALVKVSRFDLLPNRPRLTLRDSDFMFTVTVVYRNPKPKRDWGFMKTFTF